MVKMTKAQARRRLTEASEKVFKVMGRNYFQPSDEKKLYEIRLLLLKYANKLK